MLAAEASNRYRWVVLGLVLLSQVANTLAGQSVAPLAPLFQGELGLSKAQVGFFSTAAFAGAWVVFIASGALCDRFGNRKTMSAGLVAAGVLLLSMAAVTSYASAMAVMFITGIGSGMVSPGATKAIGEWFPTTLRATAMGVKQGGYPIAGMIAAASLPALGLAIGWRYAIALMGLVIIACGVAIGVFFRDAPVRLFRGKRRETEGFRGLIRNRSLWSASMVAILLVTVQLSVISYFALYLNEVVLVPAVPDNATRILLAGAFLSLCEAGGVAGRVLWGMISDRVFRSRRMVVLAAVGVLSALLTTAFGLMSPGFPFWLLALLAFALGITAVGWNGLYHALLTETIGTKNVGRGIGFSLTLSQLGTVGGPPLFGFVVDLSGSYRPAWLMLAGFCALGALVAGRSARSETHLE